MKVTFGRGLYIFDDKCCVNYWKFVSIPVDDDMTFIGWPEQMWELVYRTFSEGRSYDKHICC